MKKNFLTKFGLKSNVRVLSSDTSMQFDDLQIIEAIVFASREPIHIEYLLTKISKSDKLYPVSYTHLTLPTKRIV